MVTTARPAAATSAGDLLERALQSAQERESQRAAVREREETAGLDWLGQLRFVQRALEARFGLAVPDAAVERMAPGQLAVTLGAGGQEARLHLYPMSDVVAVAARYECCNGEWWESGDIRSVAALGQAMLRRDAQRRGPCPRCRGLA